MSKYIINTYYSLLFYVAYTQSTFFISFQDEPTYYQLIHYLTLIVIPLNLVISNFIIRLVSSICFYILMITIFNYSKIFHSCHIWLISSALMVFYNQHKPLLDKRNIQVISFLQIIIQSHYLSSGLWKLRGLEPFSFEEYATRVRDYVALTMAEGKEIPLFIIDFIKCNQTLLALSYLLVLIIQLSSVIPIFIKRFRLHWSFLIILFHLMSGVFLRVSFSPTVLGLLLLFAYYESYRANNDLSTH